MLISGLGSPGAVGPQAHERGIYVMSVVGAVRHAVKAAEAGVDAVIATGSDGGGHVGSDRHRGSHPGRCRRGVNSSTRRWRLKRRARIDRGTFARCARNLARHSLYCNRGIVRPSELQDYDCAKPIPLAQWSRAHTVVNHVGSSATNSTASWATRESEDQAISVAGQGSRRTCFGIGALRRRRAKWRVTGRPELWPDRRGPPCRPKRGRISSARPMRYSAACHALTNVQSHPFPMMMMVMIDDDSDDDDGDGEE